MTAATSFDPAAVRFDETTGLVAGVVQDGADGRVLMVGWLDREALDATLATGEAHFHSRSRARLWRKGETSGNVLACVTSRSTVTPTRSSSSSTRPARHAIAARDRASTPMALPPMPPLRDSHGSRRCGRRSTSEQRCDPRAPIPRACWPAASTRSARKVTEEATEVLIAAKDDAVAGPDSEATRAALAGEMADLLYHTLVLLAERGLEPAEVLDILRTRHAG